MKTIGLIGGMSWESSAEYYRILNEETKRRLGGLHSAELVMYSVDFEPIGKLQHLGDWQALSGVMITAAQRVESAGAQVLLVCTNTMHKFADEIQANIHIPLLHIADATALAISARQPGVKTVGLLGTRFTMEQDFYKSRLAEHGLDVVVPELGDRQIVHDIIYHELVLGMVREESRRSMLQVIQRLVQAGAQGIILGCTEIPLLIHQGDTPVPVFDTTRIHAERAVDLALGEKTPD
ncbi:MAG: aspartate/glutamate racemase family protein [Candidatus Cryosericum sp.]